MSTKVIVVGAGGLGRGICDAIQAHNRRHPNSLQLVGIVDDNPSELNLARIAKRSIEYLGTTNQFFNTVRDLHPAYILGMADPDAKASLDERLKKYDLEPLSLVHPTSTVGSEVQIAPGSVIFAGARIETNAVIGRHAHINQNVTVGHDTEIGDYCLVNPGANVSGDVVIGERTLVGAGSFIYQGVRVAMKSVIGASACVVDSLEHAQTVVGVPARPTRTKPFEY